MKEVAAKGPVLPAANAWLKAEGGMRFAFPPYGSLFEINSRRKIRQFFRHRVSFVILRRQGAACIRSRLEACATNFQFIFLLLTIF